MAQLSSERAGVGRVEGHEVTNPPTNGRGRDTAPVAIVGVPVSAIRRVRTIIDPTTSSRA